MRSVGSAPRLAIPFTLSLLNSNTGKIIKSTFIVSRSSSESLWTFEPEGTFNIEGVPGTGSRIQLKFMQPGGSKTDSYMPTGTPTNAISVGHEQFEVSLIDISNPGIFIKGSDLGWSPSKTHEDLDANLPLMHKLENLRRQGAELMGLDPDTPSIPKIVLVYPSTDDRRDIECQVSQTPNSREVLANHVGRRCRWVKHTEPFPEP
jgi:2-methylaconitate cis-trans-isomerase PrpF